MSLWNASLPGIVRGARGDNDCLEIPQNLQGQDMTALEGRHPAVYLLLEAETCRGNFETFQKSEGKLHSCRTAESSSLKRDVAAGRSGRLQTDDAEIALFRWCRAWTWIPAKKREVIKGSVFFSRCSLFF